jgi:hypothetical protein
VRALPEEHCKLQIANCKLQIERRDYRRRAARSWLSPQFAICNLQFAICNLLVFSTPAVAHADGGAIRLSEHKGGYQVTVFTSPTPLRAGLVDVSVFVQDAVTGQPVPEARVAVSVAPRGRPGEAVTYRATAEAATNKLYRAAVFDLPEPGWWEMEVSVETDHDTIRVHFEVEAAAPPPRWLALWPWFSWPVVVIALYGVHRLLVFQSRKHHPAS